jgi:hypothetical protein
MNIKKNMVILTFKLILHGKKDRRYFSLHDFLIANNCNNIKLIDSFDCMVNVSAGEGYGITIREALLLDKPLILSANSAHLDLINYGGVVTVLKQHKQKANCPLFKEDIGNYRVLQMLMKFLMLCGM